MIKAWCLKIGDIVQHNNKWMHVSKIERVASPGWIGYFNIDLNPIISIDMSNPHDYQVDHKTKKLITVYKNSTFATLYRTR